MVKPTDKKFKKELDSKKKIAYIYFSILSVLNNLNLAERELELLSYIGNRGTISSIESKTEYTKIYNISIATLNNVISKLYSKKLLIKNDGRIVINPKVDIDFSTSNEFNFTTICLFKEKELIVK